MHGPPLLATQRFPYLDDVFALGMLTAHLSNNRRYRPQQLNKPGWSGRLLCRSCDLLRFFDGVTKILPIAVAAPTLVEIDISDLSDGGVFHASELLIDLDALSALMACIEITHRSTSVWH
jgi:hypothetical protein